MFANAFLHRTSSVVFLTAALVGGVFANNKAVARGGESASSTRTFVVGVRVASQNVKFQIPKTVHAGSQLVVWAGTKPRSNCTFSIAASHQTTRKLSATAPGTGELEFLWTVLVGSKARPTASNITARVSCAKSGKSQQASGTVAVIGAHVSTRGAITGKVAAVAIKSTEPKCSGDLCSKPCKSGCGGYYPPYGSIMVSGAQWLSGHGVDVISNGASDSTADNSCGNGWGASCYQCVELFERFINIEGWYHGTVGGNAQDLYSNAPSYAFDHHPNGSGYIPVPGDAIIEGGNGVGHVAIVDTVDTKGGVVNVVEQNWSPSGRNTIPISGSTLGHEDSSSLGIIGILHPIKDPYTTSGTQPPGPPYLYTAVLRNTGSGNVDVHWDTLAGDGKYERAADFVTDFSTTNSSNAVWDFFGSANGAPELGCIVLKGTASGKVEIHWDTLHSDGRYERAGDFVTNFELPSSVSSGHWQLFGTPGDPTPPELGFVALAETGSGKVELHWESLHSDGKYEDAGDFVTGFGLPTSSADAWELFGTQGGNTPPELGSITLAGTGSGHVELHWENLHGDGKYEDAGDFVSDFGLPAANSGPWDLFGTTNNSASPKLGFVGLAGTATSKVEVHWDSLHGDGKYERDFDGVSDFGLPSGNTGVWQLGQP